MKLVPKESVLEGPYWREPVRLLSAEVRNRCIGIDTTSLQAHRFLPRLLARRCLKPRWGLRPGTVSPWLRPTKDMPGWAV